MQHRRLFPKVHLVVMSGLLAACALPSTPATLPPNRATIQATVVAEPLAAASQCEQRFVPHGLPFEASIAGPPYEVLDGNGSGLAIGDLNDDGLDDLVLGNLNGPSTILWNQGNLSFRRQSLGDGQIRAVTIVDVEGDGDQDIVMAHRYQKPIFWENTGNPDPQQRFVQRTLPNVNNEAYTLLWADLEGDGDLDLITGSYDAELLKYQGLIFQQRGNGVGVFAYTNTDQGYESVRLAQQADALALALADLDGDGRRDLLVGNDFNRRDMAFLQRPNGWEAVEPFARTTENTMSFDLGDVENDGQLEIFAGDMKPRDKSNATMAAWLPMMQRLTRPLSADDPQYAENVLQVRMPDGTWKNQGYDRMLDSSGWSWSSKFGDLDNDGFVDMYSVNGMFAKGLFDHLPNQELVEANVAFQNDQRGIFHLADQWGLDQRASGRGMSMADLDRDGDLDIVVNNLNSPAMLLENRLCGGQGVLVDLHWSGTKNQAAIGATIRLATSVGVMTREVKSLSGYLSGDTSQVHFGIPQGAAIERLEIFWPDGQVSFHDGVQPQTAIRVTR
jgi:hypothetical protein